MKRRLAMVGIMVLSMASMGVGAQAMHVEFESEPFRATAVQVSNGAAAELETRGFELLGTDENGAYLIYVNDGVSESPLPPDEDSWEDEETVTQVYANGRFLRLNEEALAGVLQTVGAETLPSIASYPSLERRMTGDDVVRLQETLIELEFLKGSADGYFGGQSQRAVSAFQRAMGLEETGVADPMLQMLMDSVRAKPVTVEASAVVPADPYTAISGKTEANLDAAVDLGLTLDYDDIAGVGMISKGAPFTYAADARSDLDRRSFALRFGLRAEENEAGEVSVVPVLEITCTGVQRSIMQEALIKSGDERHSYTIENQTDGLSGLMAVETAWVALDDETVEMLANAADNGELKVRVTCRYGEYDIVFSGESLENAAQVGEAALRLND